MMPGRGQKRPRKSSTGLADTLVRLYIDLKNAGVRITFADDTLTRCGGVPSDPQFFRDIGAIDELLSQLGDLLPSSP